MNNYDSDNDIDKLLNNQDFIEEYVFIEHETELAILAVSPNLGKIWLPKSQIKYEGILIYKTYITILIPKWLLKTEGQL